MRWPHFHSWTYVEHVTVNTAHGARVVERCKKIGCDEHRVVHYGYGRVRDLTIRQADEKALSNVRRIDPPLSS